MLKNVCVAVLMAGTVVGCTSRSLALPDAVTPTDGLSLDATDIVRVDVIEAALDAGTDAGTDVVDTAPPVDAARDVPSDASTDVAPDAAADVAPDIAYDVATDAGSGAPFCSIGTLDSAADVAPDFCVRQFVAPAMLREPRVMAFAPNGDLFVSAPSDSTGAGLTGGPGAIVVISDDDADGIGEMHTFATNLNDVHGIAFGTDGLYFTTNAGVFRTAYTSGQRAETVASRILIANFTNQVGRWTHGLGITPRGAIYASTGVWGSTCPDTNSGSIARVGMNTMEVQAFGFRNPMYLRCHFRDEVCMAAELGDDGGGTYGAREKILVIRAGSNYGYPCCARPNFPLYASGASCDPSTIASEEAWFPINHTPFGLDWERGLWPAPYRDIVVVALHGSFYSTPSWFGTGIVYATSDPVTHAPTGEWQYLVRGFGDPSGPHHRATDVVFAPDGRLFFTDDHAGGVYWMAPRTLRMR